MGNMQITITLQLDREIENNTQKIGLLYFPLEFKSFNSFMARVNS